MKTTPVGARDATGSAKALVKGISLVDALAGSPKGLRLSELVKRADLPRATVLRLLDALIEASVIRASEDGAYRLGPQCAVWGQSFLSSLELRRVAADIMGHLVELSGETCHLGVRDGDRVLYIHQIESPQALRAVSRVGGRNLLHCTGLGKCLLAFSPDADVERFLELPLERRTPNTITDPAVLARELVKVRRNGYAIDNIENQPALRCVGAPIFNHAGLAEGSISITGPSARLTLERVETFVEPLKEAAAEISRRLGHMHVITNAR